MRIKTQFLISITVFSIIVIITGASVAVTQQQINTQNNREAVANAVQTGASDLNYISNNYFLYQDSSYLGLWQTTFASLSSELSKLNSTNPAQQALVIAVKNDLTNLNAVFAGVTSFLSTAPRNESVRVLPGFQTQWDRMAVQTQALAFDSQQLSQSIREQTDQAIGANAVLIVALLASFGVFFVTIYFITYRGTVKSISKLKKGIGVIGSGNLDYTVEAGKKDEIADISRTVNEMASNLRNVTASKSDLEREIEDRKKAEDGLRYHEALLSGFFDSPGIMRGVVEIIGWKDIRHLKDNIVTASYVGLTPKDMEGKLSSELGEPQDRINIWLEHYKQSEESGKLETWEYLDVQDSKQRWLAATVNFMGKGANGNPQFTYFVDDVTERKKNEAKLRESKVWEANSFYTRNLIEASLDPLVTINAEGKVTDVNKATENVTGCSREELIGSDFSSYFTDPEKAAAGYKRVFAEGFVVDYPLSIRHKSGRVTEVLYNASLYRNVDGQVQGVFAAARDVTERKRLEKKLQDSERLATIGATAGMVGHDIRNPLQAITSDVYLAKTELAHTAESEEKKNALESLTEIEKNIDYINKIVADLQDYARPLNPVAKETDLENLCQDVLLKSMVPNNIEASCKVDDVAKLVLADPDLLKRVLSNLVLNAVQAMPEGGKLSVNAYRKEGDVVIEVADTGVGIPDDVKDKLFTPMFTTKSKGQGFGLSVVKRVTESMNGTVAFKSQRGKGTTFIVRLPMPQETKR